MNFVSSLFLFYLVILLSIRWILIPISFTIARKLGNFANFHTRFFNSSFVSKNFKNRILVIFLLISSYIFYATWNYKFLSLLLFTSFTDFWLGKFIYNAEDKRHRKMLLSVSIALNLSILGTFKYFNFLVENFQMVLSTFGYSLSRPAISLLLPAGISFYTFQSLSYTIDIYRNIISPEKNFLRYALFLAFFPQLVAGPIVVAFDFLPQILSMFRRKFSELNLNKAFYFILIGFIKKSVIADNISIISDIVFSSPDQIHSLSWKYLLFGAISYSIQIYGDFSGYTDIARGVALLFGFSLPENFNLPYFSSSLTDFWRRWHISLSSWLRSYLYIPLGGNRYSNFDTYRNLFVTMLLGGLWHGASWNFVLWGGMHGFYLGIERYLMRTKLFKYNISDVRPPHKLFLKFIYSIFTFGIVTALWVIFRSPSLEIAGLIFSSLFKLQSGIQLSYSLEILFYSICLTVFTAHLIGYLYQKKIEEILESKVKNWYFLLYAFFAIVAVLNSGELKPFIYFVF